MEEEEKAEENQSEKANEDLNEGDASGEKKPSMIEEYKAEREKQEAATTAQKAENDRTEKLLAEQELAGKSRMATPPKKDERTDDQKAIDYSEELDKGKVDPLKEDGYKQ